MHRVELKDKACQKLSPNRRWFLMHRVELKALKSGDCKVNVAVPNAPCGVERPDPPPGFYCVLEFLMHRVELKEML